MPAEKSSCMTGTGMSARCNAYCCIKAASSRGLVRRFVDRIARTAIANASSSNSCTESKCCGTDENAVCAEAICSSGDMVQTADMPGMKQSVIPIAPCESVAAAMPKWGVPMTPTRSPARARTITMLRSFSAIREQYSKTSDFSTPQSHMAERNNGDRQCVLLAGTGGRFRSYELISSNHSV